MSLVVEGLETYVLTDVAQVGVSTLGKMLKTFFLSAYEARFFSLRSFAE